MRGGRRLLEALEQRVLRLLGHQVRVVDHERARARLEGPADDLAHQLAHLLDLDASRRALGLRPGQVRVEAPCAVRWHARTAAARRRPRAPLAQSRARAAARASVRLPTPSGPASSSAGGRRPCAQAPLASSRLMRSWPRTLSERHRAPARPTVLERPRQRAAADLLRRPRAVHDHPAPRLPRDERVGSRSRTRSWNSRRLRLQAVVRAALADALQADVDRHVEEEREVRPRGRRWPASATARSRSSGRPRP